jgi:nitroreductase
MELMELMDIMQSRRSIRAFRPDPLTPDQIDTLIEALLSAPSAGNLQSRQFFFVTNKELQWELVRAALGQDFIAEAPLVVVACTDTRVQRRYGSRGTTLYSIMDVAASVQNALLAAQSMGLGACWIGAFNEEPVHALLKLPPNLRPVTMIPVGYPAESPSPPPRVSRKAAVSFIE